MKNFALTLSLIAGMAVVQASSSAGVALCGPQGEFLFKKHCAGCHRDVTKLRRVKDIPHKLRNPSGAMPTFDKNKISDRDAEEIADYIHRSPDFRALQKKSG